jgi:hypothetical protein
MSMTTSERNVARKYLCECVDSTCRRSFSMTPDAYERYSKQGRLIAPDCHRGIAGRAVVCRGSGWKLVHGYV